MNSLQSFTFSKIKYFHLIHSSLKHFQIIQEIDWNLRCHLRHFCSKHAIQFSSEHHARLSTVDETTSHNEDKLKKLFPYPRFTLKNFYLLSTENLKKKYSYEINLEKMGQEHNPNYHCQLKLDGPFYEEFHGSGPNKKSAEANAAIKAAFKLYEARLMDTKGVPLEIVENNSKSEVPLSEGLNLFKREIPIAISDNLLLEAENLISRYQASVAPLLTNYNEDIDDKHEGQTEVLNFMTGEVINQSVFHDTDRDDQLIFHLHRRKGTTSQHSHPIDESRSEILEAISTYPVTIIEGGTGCGKSTQVPQMIFDHWTKEGKGSLCNILVAQPRRIATLSLAHWVASERKEKIGQSIGYKMRLDEVFLKENGGIMFYTGGSLREMVRRNPTFEGISHVIIDEVHERSIDTDLLLLLIKRALSKSSKLKFILMSATAHTDGLKNYLGADCVVRIPHVEKYTLTTHFIEDIVKEVYPSLLKQNKALETFINRKSTPAINYEIISDIILHIHQKKPDGAILVFLPGWNDIKHLQTMLESIPDLWVVPLHSRLSRDSQVKIFERDPNGKRKVVLSTNIAETSLTVDDVVYVVDTGLQNDSRFVPSKNISSFGTVWITKANAIQRKGRAGRIAPGEVYRLYLKQTFDRMPEFPKSEILKLPLESVILRCKSLFENENIRSLLEELIETPSPLAVKRATETLVHLRILRLEYDLEKSESLTKLGHALVGVSTSPTFSKALVYSAFVGCFDLASNYVSVENRTAGVFKDTMTNDRLRLLKTFRESTSDLLAMCQLLHQALKIPNFTSSAEKPISLAVTGADDESGSGSDVEKDSGFQVPVVLKPDSDFDLEKMDDVYTDILNGSVCQERLHNVAQVKNLFRRQIRSFLPMFVRAKESSHRNRNASVGSEAETDASASTSGKVSEFDELILGSFLSTTNLIVRKMKTERNRGTSLIAENGAKVFIHKSSVLSDQTKSDDEVLYFSTDTFHSQFRNVSVARELSSVPPLSVALFYGEDIELIPHCNPAKSLEGFTNIMKITGRNVYFCTDERTAKCIVGLRKMWTELLDYFLDNRSPLCKEDIEMQLELDEEIYKVSLELNKFFNYLLCYQRNK